jgi:hypothetical protein
VALRCGTVHKWLIRRPLSLQDGIVKDTQSKIDEWTSEQGEPARHRRRRRTRTSSRMHASGRDSCIVFLCGHPLLRGDGVGGDEWV